MDSEFSGFLTSDLSSEATNNDFENELHRSNVYKPLPWAPGIQTLLRKKRGWTAAENNYTERAKQVVQTYNHSTWGEVGGLWSVTTVHRGSA